MTRTMISSEPNEGAGIGYFPLRAAPDVLTLSVLPLTGGALTSVVVEEMISEAHEGDTSRLGRSSSPLASLCSP